MRKLIDRSIELLIHPIFTVIRRKITNEIKMQLTDIDVGLQLRAILASADFVSKNIPLHKRFDHESLRQKSLELAPKEGLVLEFGVSKGKWINKISSWTSRTVYGFDSFEGLPEPWFFYEAGHYKLEELPKVNENVVLVKGWFKDSLPPFLNEHPEAVAFIHMDCDLYSSTQTVLECLKDRLQVGSVIVLDDFMALPGWEKEEHKAFLDFVEKHGFRFEYVGYSTGVPSCSVAIRITKKGRRTEIRTVKKGTEDRNPDGPVRKSVGPIGR